MCLIVFAFRHHPTLPLVVAANRDEFYSRPTRAAHFWSTDRGRADILAGKDLNRGGTWLGMTRGGRIAFVTNVRNPGVERGDKSRGLLTRNFLAGQQLATDYLQQLQGCLHDYAGFNVLLGDQQGLYHLNSENGKIQELRPGIYGLSNASMDSNWPKVNLSKSALGGLLDQEDVSIDSLTAIMLDRDQAPDPDLPETGIPRELERQLSPRFIVNPERDYGTRCTTAIVVNAQGTVRFSEQNYGSDGAIVSRQAIRFKLLTA